MCSEVEFGADLIQTTDAKKSWEWAPGFFNPLVNDYRIEFVCELSGLPITIAIRDLPFQFNLPRRCLLGNLNINPALFCEVMHGKSGEYSLRSDDVETGRFRRCD